jgi:pectin methylesterase-like acyl-CoA thioesterase
MFTFDAFSFVQVTLVFTTLVGLTAALLMSPDDTPENAGPPDAARRPIAWSGS